VSQNIATLLLPLASQNIGQIFTLISPSDSAANLQLVTKGLTKRIHVCSQLEDNILNNHCYKVSQNVVNCNKLS